MLPVLGLAGGDRNDLMHDWQCRQDVQAHMEREVMLTAAEKCLSASVKSTGVPDEGGKGGWWTVKMGVPDEGRPGRKGKSKRKSDTDVDSELGGAGGSGSHIAGAEGYAQMEYEEHPQGHANGGDSAAASGAAALLDAHAHVQMNGSGMSAEYAAGVTGVGGGFDGQGLRGDYAYER